MTCCPAPSEMRTEPEPNRCGCGNTVGTPFVTPKQKHSATGWILVSIGISHPPEEVVFTCDRCGEELKKITDKNLLKKHAYR